MFYLEVVYALLVALAIALFWTVGLGKRGPWDTAYWFVLVIFLCAWSGGIWVSPFGPTGWGVSWLPFLMMGAIGALLLVAALPRLGHATSGVTAVSPEGAATPQPGEGQESRVVTAAFWIIITALIVLILSRYTWYPRIA